MDSITHTQTFFYFTVAIMLTGPIFAGAALWSTRSWWRKLLLSILFWAVLSVCTPSQETLPDVFDWALFMWAGVAVECAFAGLVRYLSGRNARGLAQAQEAAR